jgi:hypothetical protein
VTADNKTITYGDADPAFTFTYSGFVNSETAAVIDTAPTCGVSGAHTAVGTYPIVCAGGLDNNYSFTYVNGTLTVQAWTLNGYYQPVDMNNVLNTVKNGSTVPLKFNVFAGTTEKTNTGDIQSFRQIQINCTTSSEDAVEELATTGGTSLRYDTTGGQFVQNWQTPKKAGTCWRAVVTTDDGSTISALFKLK